MIHPARVVLLLTILTAVALHSPRRVSEVLVSFSGAVEDLSKNEITIEPEPDNQMTFVRTKKTTIHVRPEKKWTNRRFRAAALTVRIDAMQKLNGELEAVTVTECLPGISRRDR